MLRLPAAVNRSAFVPRLRSDLAALRELQEVPQSEHDRLMRSDVDAQVKLIESKIRRTS